jgi:hypothetical protein
MTFPATPNRRRLGMAAAGALLLGHGSRVAATPNETPEGAAERLLAALGGRAAWAALHSTLNDSQQYRTEEPVEVRAVIRMDFKRPRWRIETTAPGLRLIRAVDGDRSWRLSREGRIEALSDATLQGDTDWYAGHIYRTIHRMASRDPLLVLRRGADGRLEVHEAGRRVAWMRLTAAGEPYAYSGLGDGAGSICGPWTAVDQGIRHPAWTAVADGSWRSTLNRLQANVALLDADFRPPA